jgi:hypothetical protein
VRLLFRRLIKIEIIKKLRNNGNRTTESKLEVSCKVDSNKLIICSKRLDRK